MLPHWTIVVVVLCFLVYTDRPVFFFNITSVCTVEPLFDSFFFLFHICTAWRTWKYTLDQS